MTKEPENTTEKAETVETSSKAKSTDAKAPGAQSEKTSAPLKPLRGRRLFLGLGIICGIAVAWWAMVVFEPYFTPNFSAKTLIVEKSPSLPQQQKWTETELRLQDLQNDIKVLRQEIHDIRDFQKTALAEILNEFKMEREQTAPLLNEGEGQNQALQDDHLKLKHTVLLSSFLALKQKTSTSSSYQELLDNVKVVLPDAPLLAGLKVLKKRAEQGVPSVSDLKTTFKAEIQPLLLAVERRASKFSELQEKQSVKKESARIPVLLKGIVKVRSVQPTFVKEEGSDSYLGNVKEILSAFKQGNLEKIQDYVTEWTPEIQEETKVWREGLKDRMDLDKELVTLESRVLTILSLKK